jgi:hypothetical protein
MSAVADALAGRLADWTGLPAGYDTTTLGREVDADWTFEPRAGVRIARSFGIMRAPRAGESSEIEAWVPTGAELVSSLEFRPPPSLDHAATLADLGEPEVVLATSRYEAGALVRDHVHAARGITVAVATPFAPETGGEHEQPAPYIVFVQLYAAGPTHYFIQTVGQSDVEVRAYPRSDP